MRFSAHAAICIVLLTASCGGSDRSDPLGEDASLEDIFSATKDLKTSFTVNDSTIYKRGDTIKLSRQQLAKFTHDSVLNFMFDQRSLVRVVGKIEREKEKYLVLAAPKGMGKARIMAVLFSAEGRYLNALRLLDANDQKHNTTVTITSEPTFLITRQKTAEGDVLLYTKTGYAYNVDAGGFMVVLNESNEKTESTVENVINPIDTFPRKNEYSGDYKKDERNFLTIRDGKDASTYLFFIHFQKNKGACIGELKGELKMVDDKTAIYKKQGDPCVIDFTFLQGTTVKVKEQGSCGNHRGIRCFFDDTYKRPKPPKAAGNKKKTGGRKN